MSLDLSCPSCREGRMAVFHEKRGIPTNSCILLETVREAREWPRGEIALAFCPACGHIANMAFDARLTEYSARYEETQGFSGTFSRFHRDLARRLVEEHGLAGRTVLEIGSGTAGEFLILLCEMGAGSGIGFDPAYLDDRVDHPAKERIEFIADFYGEKYADRSADFVCCKMTLEHILPTREFVSGVRRAVGDRPDTTVFFMIPEVGRILEGCAFEDVYYEHCSYFSPGSLGRLFRSCGFEIVKVGTEYGGQYLTITARPGEPDSGPEAPDDLAQLTGWVRTFPDRLDLRLGRWRERVERIRREGLTTVLWGSGSKGVAFLSALDLGEEVAAAVDINPHRHGYFMPGSGHCIVGPDELERIAPDVVIIMNPIYREEIGADLAARGLDPVIWTL